MRVKPTRLILVFVLCWTSATLLVFLRLDDRIQIQKHESKPFAHEDYHLNERENNEDIDKKLDTKTNLDLLKRNNIVHTKTAKPFKISDDLAQDKPLQVHHGQDKDIIEAPIEGKHDTDTDIDNKKIPDQHGPVPLPPKHNEPAREPHDQHGPVPLPPEQNILARVPRDQHGQATVPIKGKEQNVNAPFDPNKLDRVPLDQNEPARVPHDPNELARVPPKQDELDRVPLDQNEPARVPHDPNELARVPPNQDELHRVLPEQDGPAPGQENGIVNNVDELGKDENIERIEDKFVDKSFILPPAIYDIQPSNAPGENGLGVNINYNELSADEKKKYDKMMTQNAFSEYASLKISVRRRLPDTANRSCPRSFRDDLPSTSVIICFHNEAWTVLLRTVHSVLDRTPPHLVKEIILVDDFSDLDHLKEPLEYYMSTLKKVKILRTPKREGLIRARLLGVDNAQGSVLTFLDSHVECFPNWLEPLLTRVKEDRRRIVAPVISMINSHNFQVGRGNQGSVGILKLTDLGFKWGSLSKQDQELRKSSADPYRTPTIAGGLFAVEKYYFIEMGKYDEGMEIWGSENIEISLRIWMCGGSLEIHPCSIVGHIFRSKSPYNWVRPVHLILRKNAVRLAEVWLDEYKHYFYERIGYKLGDFGNVTARKELRNRLQCHSFQWYIDNVYPDIEIPPKSLFIGEIRQPGQRRCLDSMSSSPNGNMVAMATCHGMLGNQLWQYTDTKHLRTSIGCLVYSEKQMHMIFAHCTDGRSKRQTWSIEEDGHVILEETKQCLNRNIDSKLNIANCSDVTSQIWEFKSVRPSK